MRSAVLLVAALASSACLRKTEYRCSGDSSCGAGGVCETTGFCSIVNPECSSGRSYGESAGSRSGTCTGGGGPTEDTNNNDIDMAMPLIDGPMTDSPIPLCPIGYAALTGGTPNHLYRVITAADNWQTQEDDCANDSSQAHLAVPSDVTELTAISGAVTAANGAITLYWIGVTDSAPPSTMEGVFYNVLGAAQAYLPWDPPAPDDAGPGEDCVEAIVATNEFNDERCSTSRPAVCECGP